MWHLRDSNPCAFSVKEMFLNERARCVRGQKLGTLSTASQRDADSSGCSGGVDTCILSYRQIRYGQHSALMAYRLACGWHFVIQSASPAMARMSSVRTVDIVRYFRIGWIISTRALRIYCFTVESSDL